MEGPINVAFKDESLQCSAILPRGMALVEGMRLRRSIEVMGMKFDVYSKGTIPMEKVDDAIEMNVRLFESLARRHGLLH
jgi:hypothetical protein